MKQQNESVKELEVGKDYVNVLYSNFIVIDRTGDIENRGFYDDLYKNYLSCWNHSEWREATKEEVIAAFGKHLNHRFGEDWRTMKIKEKHPSSQLARPINNNSYRVAISKYYDGWAVWNKNGLLYCNGIWVERLEEESKIHIKEAIKENTVIHCKTKQEAERILGMAHELGYRWWNGKKYEADDTEWNIYKSTMCYYLFDGSYSEYDYFKNRDYTIIPSTQIADLEPTNEDIKEMKKYRLKKWYPSLDEKWDTTHRYEYQSSTGYMCNKSMQHCVIIYKKELHSDFWEEVEEEKPLFTTYDGVEVLNPGDWVYLVNPLFEKIESCARNSNINTSKEIVKVFYYEANADDYILWNKPLLSLKDIDATIKGDLPEFDELRKIAKGRRAK